MKKRFLPLLLCLALCSQSIKSAGDVSNAIGTTVALSGAVLVGVYSRPLFYDNYTNKIAKNWARGAAREIKNFINNEQSIGYPVGTEMDNYIKSFRAILAIATFAVIKALY